MAAEGSHHYAEQNKINIKTQTENQGLKLVSMKKIYWYLIKPCNFNAPFSKLKKVKENSNVYFICFLLFF